jgi:hypothetical protein
MTAIFVRSMAFGCTPVCGPPLYSHCIPSERFEGRVVSYAAGDVFGWQEPDVRTVVTSPFTGSHVVCVHGSEFDELE